MSDNVSGEWRESNDKYFTLLHWDSSTVVSRLNYRFHKIGKLFPRMVQVRPLECTEFCLRPILARRISTVLPVVIVNDSV